jgi:hypothetical protein
LTVRLRRRNATHMARPKFINLHGMKFCRDEKTDQKLAHRHVWEKERGPIPAGWHVHHIDRDRGNNSIENLLCLSEEDHKQLHIDEDETFERRAQRAAWFMRHAHPAAKDWHQSAEGREWHRQHALRVAEEMQPKAYTCDRCAEQFETKPYGKNRFCSAACRAAWRRDQGLDDVTRSCSQCGEAFTVNRYRKTQTCSQSCANRLKGSVAAMTAGLERGEDGRFRHPSP